MGVALDIRKNDQVQVLAGRDKGKAGRVLEVVPRKRWLFVEHVNMVKRHTRPNPGKQIRGGVLDKEGPIHISNVALVCDECGPTRIQHRKKAEGKKVITVRVCAKCEKILDR
ncbi:MAG: 50S ribosomal protein L24 [Acidobacteriia bacterium]|jgi:large subunit ribosomal protein L24|nr:50S ribosomal protein L24 [Terriglobia bacterium]